MFKIKRLNLILLITFIVSMSIVFKITFESYVNYEQTIVNQQLQQLMTIAKSISQNIDIYVNEKMNSTYVFVHNPYFENALTDFYMSNDPKRIIENVEVLYKSQEDELKYVFVINKDGDRIAEYPKTPDIDMGKVVFDLIQKDIDMVLKNRVSYTGEVYEDPSGELLINLVEPIVQNQEVQGMVIVAIRLNQIYKSLVAPIQVGEKGYAILKDKNGIILMHPAEEYVGYEATPRIRELFPNENISEVEALIQQQIEQEEGTAIYNSYWWGEKTERVKKLNAFISTNQLNWIVSVVMSYEELREPIIEFLVYIITISVILIFIFSFFIFMLIQLRRNKEAYKLELNYQKELRIRDEELQHSRRLKTIGILTGGIAHEFNNILTPIMGYAEILMKQVRNNDSIREEVQEIYESSLRGKKLIEQIMPYSSKEDKNIKFEVLQISDVIKKSLKLVKPIMPSSCTIQKDFDEDCGFVYGSNMQLHQVVMNLCTNAFHAMGEKEGTLTVRVSTVDPENEYDLVNCDIKRYKYVKILISDTGCGMDKHTLDHIFDPFFTTKAVGQGTGLGLFIVYGIITKHEGEIIVHSQQGMGSEFYIYIPQC